MKDPAETFYIIVLSLKQFYLYSIKTNNELDNNKQGYS